ncbi:MAG TPA: LexA family transcriptional regulator, partial [Terriglobales bacterium]|nr:LexA family transcriptional regulator [Terriglobales bacterium]
LQDNLRRTLWGRIATGELTGIQLAEQTGFKQAHISNFLNRKRGLSVEGMDKVLSVMRLSILDLLDPGEISRRSSISPSGEDEFENVGLVDAINAARPVILNMHVIGIHKFKKSFLRKLRSEVEGRRERWERFVMIKANGREGMSMFPRLLPGAAVLVDRHYNSLRPYRRQDMNIYAINKNGNCTLKYLEIAESNLILRPHNHAYPVEVMPLQKGRTAHEYIIGRVCHVGIEA